MTARPRAAWPAALGPHLPLLGLAAVTAIVAWVFAPVFGGEPAGDDNSFHFAEVAHLARAIAAGDLGWWNPGGNAGFASGYYYQVVPQLVPALGAAATGTSPLAWFQLGIFVPLVLAPAAAYRAMRVLGAAPWPALGAAVALPFAVGASRWGHGADGTFVVGLYTQLWAFVALPLALAHGARWIDAGARLAPALAWGLVVGLCHPFAGVALGVALAAGTPWAAWRAARGAPAGRRARAALAPAARLAGLGALLVAGAACAWLPVVVDHAGFGGFPHRVPDEVGPGFARLAAWIYRGSLLDHGRALPLVTALLVPVAALARAPWLPRLWAAAIAFALLLGAGPHLPRVGSDDLLPAVRFVGALQIVLALAAGAGAVVLVERAARLPAIARWDVARRWLLGAAVVAAAAGTVVPGAAAHRRRVKVATDFEPIRRAELGALIAAMRDEPPGRLQVRAGAQHHWAIQLPWAYARRPAALVMGGAALQSSPSYAHLWELRDRDPARAAWVFDAPLVLARRDRAGEVGGERVAGTDAYELRRLPAPGLVGPVQVVGALPPGRAAARQGAIRWLWSEAALRDQVLAHHGAGGAGPPPRGATRAVTRGPSTITAEVEVDAGAAAPTTFVIRESWHPRWRATIDGAPARLRRVTPDFLAVDVPPGRHVIALRFARPWWTWPLWLLGPALVAAAWTATRRGARRGRSHLDR